MWKAEEEVDRLCRRRTAELFTYYRTSKNRPSSTEWKVSTKPVRQKYRKYEYGVFGTYPTESFQSNVAVKNDSFAAKNQDSGTLHYLKKDRDRSEWRKNIEEAKTSRSPAEKVRS